jgi:hypothetical protein
MRKKWMMIAVLIVSALAFSVSFSAPVRVRAQGGGALSQLLGSVPDSPVSRTVMWYGSLGDLENVLKIKLNSLQDFQGLGKPQQTAYLLDVGTQVYYSPFSGTEHANEWKSTFGIDTFAIDRELTVGTSPNWYGVLQGRFDAGAITQALQGLGYQPNGNVLSLGADNASDPNNPANQIAAASYNRLVVTDALIKAAPSNAMIQAATTGNLILSDPAYNALAGTLENGGTIPNTTLLSAVLYNGSYLSDKVIGADPSGEKPLPRYQTAGIGYRRDATNRYWLVALVYANAGEANAAQAILADRLPRYASLTQGGRKLFDGWKISAKVVPAGSAQVVVVSMQMPSQTDVSLTELVSTKDLGFLATQ